MSSIHIIPGDPGAYHIHPHESTSDIAATVSYEPDPAKDDPPRPIGVLILSLPTRGNKICWIAWQESRYVGSFPVEDYDAALLALLHCSPFYAINAKAAR